MGTLSMDLTGTLESHSVPNQVYRIYKYDQRVDFETTVFASSLKVYLISGGVTTVLVKDTDFVIPEDAYCDTDGSRARLMDSSFNEDLISGIVMKRGVAIGDSYTISVSYQRLYPNQVRTAYLHNEPLNVTPELILNVIEQIERLNILTADVGDRTSITDGEQIFFPIDETYTNPDNFVRDEEHRIHVANGKYLIHPKGGSFYKDSIVVKHPASSTTLVEGKDYVIIGLDGPKTKATSSPVPVYNFIMVMAPITDFVEVTYHAFGGDPTIDNYTDMLKSLRNIVQYLNQAEFVSSATLGSTLPMVNLYERVDKLEDKVRRLQGTPAYGDITAGKTILMKLFSETPGLHWYTIASLNEIDGDTQPCTADTFMFRFQSQISHIQFTAAVSVDLNNNDGDRLIANIIAENFPRGYIPFTDYSTIDTIIRPQIRIVWKDEDSVSGAYLQLGFTLNGMLEETVQIEDISGHESCWKLVEEVATVTIPQDSDFLLPNGVSTWSSYLPACKQEHMLVPFRKGHLIWSGANQLNDDLGWHVATFDNLYLDNVTDIRKFTKLRLDIEEENGLQFPVDIQFNSGTEHLKGHASFIYQEEPVYVNAEMWKENDNILVRLNWEVLAGPQANKLSLRDMVIFLS